jgi:uncharacterized protein
MESTLTRDDIIRELQKCFGDLQRYQVKHLSLFGSAAKNELTPSSDIDILVEFECSPSFDEYMDLKIFLEDLFKRKVDVVPADTLRARIRSSVERELIRVA